jgi:predicted nucleic acid-binding protein
MLIADTGFFYALADRSDRHHARALTALEGLNEGLITTWPVLTETTHLLNMRLSPAVSVRFLGNVADGFCAIHAIDPALLRRIAILMAKYADLPMDLADASLLLLAEHLGDGRILSTDRRDFQTYRFKNQQPFRNLLLDD